jgi:hypothetical protein
MRMATRAVVEPSQVIDVNQQRPRLAMWSVALRILAAQHVAAIAGNRNVHLAVAHTEVPCGFTHHCPELYMSCCAPIGAGILARRESRRAAVRTRVHWP